IPILNPHVLNQINQAILGAFPSKDSIASYLCEDWNGYVLEANPGPGLLSKAILETGVSHLRVFEKNVDLFPTLEILSNTYSNFEIIKENLMLLPSLDARMPYDESNEYEKFFKGIPNCSYSNGVPFRLFSIISNKRGIKFLRYLLTALPAQSSLFSYGRCELFLMLSKAEYQCMQAEPKENFSMYRWSTVLYSLFFEIKCLKKFSSESFFPSPVYRKAKKMRDLQHFYLVKLTPVSDLPELVTDNNKLLEFYYFVRNHFGKRTAFVIPTMEKWIPFCGPRLIKEGMNVFTRFGDLNPKQILMLFNQFSSWPEYEDSSFHTAFQKYNKKLASDKD
ncbi:dimethyladenosine transferase 2, mitochondrial-like, partial [Stegodyphus dumicola]|uniref:dimethyladenosine transferase 2, mitochondrial-like n=1 Tax=Stegodyphus dumicola TaxID=202533 RepID=UPI0015A9B1F2